MVANQLHLLSRCDYILRLEGNAVAESGTYEQLIKQNGDFADLIHKHVFDVGDQSSNPTGETIAHIVEHTAIAKSEKGGELVKVGAVNSSVYVDYIRSIGWGLWITTMLSIVVGYGAMAFTDVWLSIWIAASDGDTEAEYGDDVYPIVFGGSTLTFIIFMMLGSVLYTVGGFRASKAIHYDCISRMLYAPYSWFQDTPTGRITSRFTTDLGFVDIQLSFW